MYQNFNDYLYQSILFHNHIIFLLIQVSDNITSPLLNSINNKERFVDLNLSKMMHSSTYFFKRSYFIEYVFEEEFDFY
jgi:hypothetical protein